MPSPAPSEDGSKTPRRSSRNPEGSRTPSRNPEGSRTPSRVQTPSARTPSRRGNATPRREDASPAKSIASSTRTPRKGRNTPAKSVSTVDTPMRFGVPRNDIDGQSEIPSSPAHSLAPTSPGTGLLLLQQLRFNLSINNIKF